MSVQAVGWVMEQPVPPAAKLVLVSIANHADRVGRNAWPSQESIAIESTMGERTVRRHVLWLEEHGWIVRYRRGRPDGTGRSSDGYEIPGLVGESPEDARRRLAAEGRAVIWPSTVTPTPVDDEAQPANLAGSGRDDRQGSTGQSVQLNRPIRAAEPATGGRGTVQNRPEPMEEEARDAATDLADALVDRLPAAQGRRLSADVGFDRLVDRLARLLDVGWTSEAAVGALLANPLVDHRGEPVTSIAAVLGTRADRLAALGPPPAAGTPAGPEPDCPMCRGGGVLAFEPNLPGALTEYRPCPCRKAA